MRITVFGAAGNVGSRIVAEARARGHNVTAVARDPDRLHGLGDGVAASAGSADDVDDVIELSSGRDLVVSATRPPAGAESQLAATARTLMSGLSHTGGRLLLVGGAASLRVPGANGATVFDDPDFPPALWGIAQACNEQLAVCRAETRVDWTYLSPPARLEPGKRTGQYRLGGDELVTDAQGNSAISMEDFAVALLDEAQRPRHHRDRFTVGY